jgi:hypothetical protein
MPTHSIVRETLAFVATSAGTVPINAAYARESRVGIRHSARTGWRAAFDVTTCLRLSGESGRSGCSAGCLQPRRRPDWLLLGPLTYVDSIACARAATRAPPACRR